MTVSTTTSRNDYVAIAAQTIFPYTFKILYDSDLEVYIDGVLKMLSTHYTVTGAGGSGGNVTFLTPMVGGEDVAIIRNIPLTQDTDYVENDPFPAETHEAALDKLTMIVQQVDNRSLRSIRIPETDASGTLTELPVNTARASKFLAFDTDGDVTVTGVAPTGTAIITPAWETVLDDTTLPLSIETIRNALTEELSIEDTDEVFFRDTSANLGKRSTLATFFTKAPFGLGQCVLVKDGVNLRLIPKSGNRITINGVNYAVPAAGVALAPASIAASTVYYIYAYISAGSIVLEASATGHSVDSTTGVEIKTADSTRTLVGMARTDGAVAWEDNVRSWFNDTGFSTYKQFTTNRSIASSSPIEIHSEIRAGFLIWSGEKVSISSYGASSVSIAPNINIVQLAIDTTTLPGYFQETPTSVNNQGFSMNFVHSGATEGYHYATLYGWGGAYNQTWSYVSTVLSVSIEK